MRVTILFNVDEGLAHGETCDAVAVLGVRDTARAVAAACSDLGWEATLCAAPEEPGQLVTAISQARPDVVFNLVESLRGEARLEAAVASVLELVGVPYTGSPALALGLALDKGLARTVLQGRGVTVPAGRIVEHGDEPLDDLPFPCLVKPLREDASLGIAVESVVPHAAAARARARYIHEHYRQPALVEEFVPGREFNVSVLGHGASVQILPLAEIDFSGLPAGHPPLVTYEAKWVETSPAYRGTPSVPAASLPPELETRIREQALAAAHAIGVRDYGRVDLRLAPDGPRIVDVNPNPDLSPDAGLVRAAARAGIDFTQLVGRIVESARARQPR